MNIGNIPPVSLHRDWADIAALVLTLALVIVGAWGIRVALRTLKAIERQTKHTVNTERPWLFLEPYSQGFSNQYRAGESIKRLDWRISNRGKTVANVIEAQIFCKKIKDIEAERRKVFSVPPNYGKPIPFFEVPLAPEGNLDAWSYLESNEGRASEGLDKDDIQDIRERNYILAAFGYVKYKDQFGEVRESRFCYYYAIAFQDFRIFLGAPAEYHKCT